MMNKPHLSPLALRLLNILLDRYERPNRQQVVRVHLSHADFDGYSKAVSAEPRRSLHEAVLTLADAGILHLHWQRYEEGNWLESVDLVAEEADRLYALLGRTPRTTQKEQLLRLLNKQYPRAAWLNAFIERAKEQLVLHKSPTPLRLDDSRFNQDFLTAIAAIADLEQPILERLLSVRLFRDSKRLEELRSTIVAILRRYAPHAQEYGDDDAALLRAFWVERVPEYIPIAGTLTVSLANQLVSLTPLTPSVALSVATIQQITTVECSADAVVTIENATSFTEWITIAPSRILTIYTGGFASPSALMLLRMVRHCHPHLAFYHWGDMDAGGLRILAHLRREIGDVIPLGMDTYWLEKTRAYSQTLSSNDRGGLERLQNHPLLTDCSILIHYLLTHNLKLEQEAIASQAVLQSLISQNSLSGSDLV
jgi:hypothetical protein